MATLFLDELNATGGLSGVSHETLVALVERMFTETHPIQLDDRATIVIQPRPAN